MNKRFTSLMTTLILSVFFSISASAYDVEVDGIYYNLNTVEKTASVTYKDFLNGSYSGDVVIPSVINIDNTSYSIIAISNMAFNRCSTLKSVTMPNSVIRIGEKAFSHCN